jgi:hypothetical protein
VPKQPAFQFYPGDWAKDAKLRRCSLLAKGAWIEMILISFDCDERGRFADGDRPWSDDEIASAIHGDQQDALNGLKELLDKGVATRDESGAVICRRVVRDEEWRRGNRQRQSRFRDRHAEDEPKSESKPKPAERFADFWNAYPRSPRKKEKAKCEQRWRTWGLDKHADVVLQRLAEDAQSKQWQDEQFIPAPFTWLNKKRWLDDPADSREAFKPETCRDVLDAVHRGEVSKCKPPGEQWRDLPRDAKLGKAGISIDDTIILRPHQVATAVYK